MIRHKVNQRVPASSNPGFLIHILSHSFRENLVHQKFEATSITKSLGSRLDVGSLSQRPKTNRSADHFQYHMLGILEVIYALDEVWGQD